MTSIGFPASFGPKPPQDLKTNLLIAALYYKNGFFQNAIYSYDYAIYASSHFPQDRNRQDEYLMASIDRLALLYYAVGDDYAFTALLDRYKFQSRYPVLSYLTAARHLSPLG